MPLAIGGFVTTGVSRQFFQVIGTYTVPGLVAAFRAMSSGNPETQIFVQNADVDTNFTAFTYSPAATPAGAPPVGSRVTVHASPLAFINATPLASFPLTEKSITGIVLSYLTIDAFPGYVAAAIVEPDGNMFVAGFDELTFEAGAT